MPEFSSAVLPPLSVISHRLHTISINMQNTVLIIQTLKRKQVMKLSFVGHSRFIRTDIKHKAIYNLLLLFSSSHVSNKQHLWDRTYDGLRAGTGFNFPLNTL